MPIDPALVEIIHRTRPRERTPHPLPPVAGLALAVMFGLGIAALAMAGNAREERTTRPLLGAVPSHTIEHGTTVVSGVNFTPGGDVFITVHTVWGEAAHDTRWTTALAPTAAITGSHDPNLGFHPGGAVHETFELPCGRAVMVQAFDERSGTWSNVLDLDVDCGG